MMQDKGRHHAMNAEGISFPQTVLATQACSLAPDLLNRSIESTGFQVVLKRIRDKAASMFSPA